MTFIIEDSFDESYDGGIKIVDAADKVKLDHFREKSPILDIPEHGLIITVSSSGKWPQKMAIWYEDSQINIDALEGRIGPYEPILGTFGREIFPDEDTGHIKLSLSNANRQPGNLNDPDTTVTIGDAPPEIFGKKKE